MNKKFPAFNLSNGAASNGAVLRQGLQLQRLPALLRSPLWSGLLGALVILGMLLAFQQVVHGAVQQSALRHKATALHAEATWRCNALQGKVASDSCLLQLNAPAYRDTAVEAQTTLLARHDGLSSP